jgi:hypothetical protein
VASRLPLRVVARGWQRGIVHELRSGKHCIASKTALRFVLIASLERSPFGKAFAISTIAAVITIRIHFSGQPPVIKISFMAVR